MRFCLHDQQVFRSAIESTLGRNEFFKNGSEIGDFEIAMERTMRGEEAFPTTRLIVETCLERRHRSGL